MSENSNDFLDFYLIVFCFLIAVDFRMMMLEEEQIYVQTKQFIEEMAKERWGLVKPGEIILKPSE